MLVRLCFLGLLLSVHLVSGARQKQERAPGQTIQTDVLVIGGGTSGVMAGIQAARMGVKVLVVEETEWLGGMMTAAGVSAIDGDHQLPAGLWGEFRQRLYNHYGGAGALETGWVSNTLFEPSEGNALLKQMAAAETKLQIWYRSRPEDIVHQKNGWKVNVERTGQMDTVKCSILIDATELGDVMAKAGVHYRIGMDSRYKTGEEQAPEQANGIIQDLTYVATLKDYGAGADRTIPRPAGYDSSEFACCCQFADPASDKKPARDCHQMLEYGHLPNHKFMINWPFCGNDLYLNFIENTPQERIAQLTEARLHTLRFIYYIQTALGFKRLGLADDEYPTKDKLPMIAYYREGRRCIGLAQLSLPYIQKPFTQSFPLYRTGIAVGDYPIDHHHAKNSAAPRIEFVKIKVPSFNIPMGCLIPAGVGDLIVAEKGISVTNLVNGATRLQPVVIQLGQAAGIMAALCVRQHIEPSELSVRNVQLELLNAGGYLMPYLDVSTGDPQFMTVQKIGATGILKGVGIPHNWANETWFYPEKPADRAELYEGLRPYYPVLEKTISGQTLPDSLRWVTMDGLAELFTGLGVTVDMKRLKNVLYKAGIGRGRGRHYSRDTPLSRRELSVLLEYFLHPFDKAVTILGEIHPSAN